MKAPVAFEPTPQKTVHDCATACLKMMAGVGYEQVVAAWSPRAKVHKNGASDRQILNAAKKLGCPLSLVKDADLSETVGILSVLGPDKDRHVVMLARGAVYDPGPNLLWPSVEEFLDAGQYRVDVVFVEEEEDE